jgi:benzoyl-CoA-dihydrodiol lyase
VLPGTGGLTRLVDKRKVRRDRADVFSTTAEGIRGKKAKEWNLVDGVFPRSKFDQEAMKRRAAALAAASSRARCPGGAQGRHPRAAAPELGAAAAATATSSCRWDDASRTSRS